MDGVAGNGENDLSVTGGLVSTDLKECKCRDESRELRGRSASFLSDR